MKSKFLFLMILMMVFIGGCRWFSSPEFASATWSPEHTATFGEKIDLDVVVEKNGFEPGEVLVLLQNRDNQFQVNKKYIESILLKVYWVGLA